MMESNKNENKENGRVLTKKDIRNLSLRTVFLQASFNYERMQAGGWLLTQLPALKKIYKNDKAGLSAAMKDNLEFINTSPPLVSFLYGLLISLEESKEDRQTIKGLKVALFGPLAGIGDALFWFTLLPITAGISASFAQEGSIIGPILFFLVFIILLVMRLPLGYMGYNLGVKAIEKIRDNSVVIAKTTTILGITVIGGLIASYVKLSLIPTFAINEDNSISLQKDFLDNVFPNILPLGFTLFLYWLIKKKNVSPLILILGTFIMAILFSFLGIL